MSKNVLILLDLSGSMLGQRFEIAKQTIEAIFDTMYDNDFFNILAVIISPLQFNCRLVLQKRSILGRLC